MSRWQVTQWARSSPKSEGCGVDEQGGVQASPEVSVEQAQIELARMTALLQSATEAIARAFGVVEPMRKLIAALDLVTTLSLREAEDKEMVLATLDVIDMAGRQLLQFAEIVSQMGTERAERGEEL